MFLHTDMRKLSSDFHPIRPLTNYEIDEYGKKNIPHWCGVFMRDELVGLLDLRLQPHPWAKPTQCTVVNLDSSSGFGTHWVCFYLDQKNKVYFDSFGSLPPEEILQLFELRSTSGGHERGSYERNSLEIQPRDSVICGHMCLFVLENLAYGESFQDILSYII